MNKKRPAKRTRGNSSSAQPTGSEQATENNDNQAKRPRVSASPNPPTLFNQPSLPVAATAPVSFSSAPSSMPFSLFQGNQQQIPQQPVSQPQTSQQPAAGNGSGMFYGFSLEAAGITLPRGLSAEERRQRLLAIEQEISHQAANPPVRPPSELDPLPKKDFIGRLYEIPEGEESTRLGEILRQKNEDILDRSKRQGKDRNNLAAKNTRGRREETIDQTRELLIGRETTANFWKVLAISRGASPGAWEAVPENVKEAMADEIWTRFNAAEEKRTRDDKTAKAERQSANTKAHVALVNEDRLRKAKEVEEIRRQLEEEAEDAAMSQRASLPTRPAMPNATQQHPHPVPLTPPGQQSHFPQPEMQHGHYNGQGFVQQQQQQHTFYENAQPQHLPFADLPVQPGTQERHSRMQSDPGMMSQLGFGYGQDLSAEQQTDLALHQFIYEQGSFEQGGVSAQSVGNLETYPGPIDPALNDPNAVTEDQFPSNHFQPFNGYGQ
ncbi:hypothetical protein ACJ41O_008266 [Fusarium nematophilum]